MADIPTELLRSLIAVVDCRSYTKAARRLGLTQSTVSTQIKRLQEVVGCTLFDKSAPGVRLTENGERVVASGRRILSINDECISHISPEPSEPTLRIGIPSHFIGAMLSPAICQIRGHSHRIRLHIQSDISDKLLADLRDGELDLVVALTLSEPALGVRHHWTESVVWIGQGKTNFDRSQPVPLVTFPDNCAYRRIAVSTLEQAGRKHEIVFTGNSIVSLTTAVAAGVGVTVVTRRAAPPHLAILEGADLPKLSHLVCGIYSRSGHDEDVLNELADRIAQAIERPGAAPIHGAAA